MQDIYWILAAFFLPLFPAAMLFNAIFQRARSIWLRVMILLAWPLPGVWILTSAKPVVPDWIIYWALFSAVLYGFRAVVVKEFSIWMGFFASSAWSLTWIIQNKTGITLNELLLHVLAFSIPLALLSLLVAELERRYQSAYTGVVSGIAQAQPRLSGLFVIAMLAVIGSPLFPAFFSMLDTVTHTIMSLPAIAVGVVMLWLLWSWSGIRLLQDLLVGSGLDVKLGMPQADVSYTSTMAYAASLVILIIAGIYVSRILI